jgi:hypothetical protein
VTRWHPGVIYEDCAHHAVLCCAAEPNRNSRWWRRVLHIRGDTDLMGISLFDGSRPRSCSVRHCAPRKLTLAGAVALRGAWEQGRRGEGPASAESELRTMQACTNTLQQLPDEAQKRVILWVMDRFKVNCGC